MLLGAVFPQLLWDLELSHWYSWGENCHRMVGGSVSGSVNKNQ